jgi:hypothetical protein
MQLVFSVHVPPKYPGTAAVLTNSDHIHQQIKSRWSVRNGQFAALQFKILSFRAGCKKELIKIWKAIILPIFYSYDVGILTHGKNRYRVF